MPHHLSTPKKAGLIAAINTKDPFHYSNNDIFRKFGVSKTTGYKVLREADTPGGQRSFHSAYSETRGRKKKLTEKHIAILIEFIEKNGFDGRTVPYEGLIDAAGIDLPYSVSARTIQRALKFVDFRRCIACEKQYISPDLKKKRLQWAKDMLRKYPTPEAWRRIRFSDECHFGWDPQGKIWILRRPWERNCSDCIVEKEDPKEKDRKRIHCWAAIGYNFKSSLVWYDVPGNDNGKMSLKVYKEKILEPVVGEWLRKGEDFVLEEDNDCGHGGGKNNIVKKWKEDNGLEHYFNCSGSPDFVPIEKAWQSPKQYLRKRGKWDDEICRELVEEGWAALSQERINLWIDQIPQILRECIELEGALTAH